MRFYFYGIKGSGMAALAMLLKEDGYDVRGCDVDKPLFTEASLKEKAISIEPFPLQLPSDVDCIIVGHSFVHTVFAMKSDRIRIEYHHFLAFYLPKKELISVAGSHGKTTLVGLLSHLLDCSYLRGDGEGRKRESDPFFVLESCEYQLHFLAYHPHVAIFTNIDYDHVDFFPTITAYQNAFLAFAKQCGFLIIPKTIHPLFLTTPCLTFGAEEEADYSYQAVRFSEGKMHFTIVHQAKVVAQISTGLVGVQLIENIVACYAFFAYQQRPFPFQRLESFTMAHQRFNIFEDDPITFIVDYAHHPSQIAMHRKNVRTFFPKRKNIAIFQPDRYSRLTYFLPAFVDILSTFDAIYILELPLMEENKGKTANVFPANFHFYETATQLVNDILLEKGDVYSLMSSKNMTPLHEMLKKRKKESNL